MSVVLNFYRGHVSAMNPQRATATIDDASSHRASLFCHPFLSANAYGWLLLPPLDVDLIWNGGEVAWRQQSQANWLPLDIHTDIASFLYLCEKTPEPLRQYMNVPLLAVGPEPGLVQLWSGLFVTSQAGWCVTVRPLVNRRPFDSFDVLEGIVDSDWWLGPLVFPIQIRKTDRIVRIRRNRPLAQLQPISRQCLQASEDTAGGKLREVSSWSEEDWRRFQFSMQQKQCAAKPGSYRTEARTRQRDFVKRAGTPDAD